MEEIDNETNGSSVPAVTRRVAYLLALAALVLPCGLLIVAAFWIYRHVRAFFARRAATPVPGNHGPLL